MKTEPRANKGLRTLFFTLLLLVVGFVALIRYAYQTQVPGEEISLDYVYVLAGRGLVKEATLLDEDAQIVGRRCVPRPGASEQPAASATVAPTVGDTVAPAPPAPVPAAVPTAPETEDSGPSCTRTRGFNASYPQSDVATQQLIQTLTVQGAKVVVDKQTDIAVAKLLLNFIFPLAMLANLFGIIFMWKGGESSIADIAGFGKLGKKRERERRAETGVTFSDVAGAGEAVAEMREVIDYLQNPGKFEEFRAAPPKGVLLFGPPGCGKTLLARATAGESNVPFFSVSGTEFVESLVGVGAARVRDLFRQVREVAPAIMFIDEIDAVGRKRTGEGASGGEREQTLNQLLVEMDGFEVSSGIVVMGATNRPDILDPALMRPGRFDRHVTLTAPDVHGRREILELHARGRPVSDHVDLEMVARRTPGFTGADLANVINEAALLAIREAPATADSDGQTVLPTIQPEHVGEAIQRVLHGPQRRGQIISPDERRRLAYHESGHAVAATALGHHEKVQRLSIIARGRGLGQAQLADESEKVLLTLAEMRTSLAVAMAGTAAEKLAFGDASSTAEEDIQNATSLAREMIGLYGMSDKIGPLHLLKRYGGYLSDDAAAVEDMAPSTMASFDEETRALVEQAERVAFETLEQNREALDALVRSLEEDETLEGASLSAALAKVRQAQVAMSGNSRRPAPAAPEPESRRPSRSR